MWLEEFLSGSWYELVAAHVKSTWKYDKCLYKKAFNGQSGWLGNTYEVIKYNNIENWIYINIFIYVKKINLGTFFIL